MKHLKRVNHEVEIHSRALFEALGLPDYESIYDLKASVTEKPTSSDKGHYFHLKISFQTDVEKEADIR